MMYTGLAVGMFMMLFVTPAYMAMGVKRMNEERKLTFGEKVACCIPFVNMIKAEIDYYGHIKLYTISLIVNIITTAQRIYTLFYMREQATICTVSVIVFIIGWLFTYIANMVFVYDIITVAGNESRSKAFLNALIYPIGQYYVGTTLPNVVRNTQKQAETFTI